MLELTDDTATLVPGAVPLPTGRQSWIIKGFFSYWLWGVTAYFVF
jgi:hypothetical protein